MTETCPLCLQDVNCVADTRMINFAHFLDSKDCHLEPMRVRLLMVLVMKAPKPLHSEYLKDVLWGADPTGGPDTIDNTLKVHILRIRRRLAESLLDWKIECIRTLGYYLEGDVSEALAAL